MNTPNLRYFLYGIVLTASLSSLATQAAGPDGVFGDYFQNIITDAASCGAGTAISGFDSTPGTGFGTQECTTFDNLVNSVLKTFGAAPVGQAVVGYDPATGNPIYGDVNWQRSGADISYTPGKVGIGTALPSQALDVNGYLRLRSINGEGGTIQLDGNNGTNVYLENINGIFRLVNSPWNKELFSVDQNSNVGIGAWPWNGIGWPGSLNVNGSIRGARYYDDDTNYYVDANTTSVMNQVNTNQVCIGGDCANTWHSAGTNVFNTIVDEVTNAAGDNVAGYPCGLNSAPNTFRWMNTCASRACQARGYRAGLVQEITCFSPSCGISLTCF